MVAGRYDPQVAQAIGYKHGDPLEGVEGSKDGLAAVAKFINASMEINGEERCKKLIQATAQDNVRRLAQLRDVTVEEIAVLQDWDKHLAREFMREVDLMLRVMGWREVVLVTAQAHPEVVVQTGVRRDRPFPKPPNATDSSHAGWGPWGVGRAPIDWGYTTPGWASEFCSNGAAAKV